MKKAVALALLLYAAPLAAEPLPSQWSAHRPIADYISTGLVGLQIGAETWTAARSSHPRQALTCEAIRIGTVIGVSEAVKRIVSRRRPDGSDQMSFYSEHTALATVAAGWRVEVGFPIALGTGYLRTAAGKHYLSDVAVGAAVGVLARKLCADF